MLLEIHLGWRAVSGEYNVFYGVTAQIGPWRSHFRRFVIFIYTLGRIHNGQPVAKASTYTGQHNYVAQNPKIHLRINNSSPPVLIMSQSNQIHTQPVS
jgi:hypothetical protein